jgi:peptidyl-Asp metalloendopeptidase
MKPHILALTALLSGAAIADDYLIPPEIYAPQSEEKAFHEMPRPVNPNELITIDVLVLYTPGVASAQLVQMMTDANDAYRDSGVNIHLRAIHIQEVAYTAHSNNADALRALTNESDPAFHGVYQLRNDAKADLVVLVRPFDWPIHDSCGAAWLLGKNEQAHLIHKQSNYAYSVVSVGTSGGYSCSKLAFVHELGHNMGLTHDKESASQKGAFHYSYGYQVPGVFGTIMAYSENRIARFSSPLQYCSGNELCGSEDADNVRSLNDIRATIANFRN